MSRGSFWARWILGSLLAGLFALAAAGCGPAGDSSRSPATDKERKEEPRPPKTDPG